MKAAQGGGVGDVSGLQRKGAARHTCSIDTVNTTAAVARSSTYKLDNIAIAQF